jgi:hypothetical protein
MAKVPAAAKKLVPTATESTTATGTRRVRLSRALATKPQKLKLVSDRYKIPDNEYADLMALKKRLLLLNVNIKKSELLRAGLMLLVAMGDIQLKKAVAKLKIVKAAQTTN